LDDRGASPKKASKSLIGATKTLQLEEATLSYLQIEYSQSRELAQGKDEEKDLSDLVTQLEAQEERVQQAKAALRRHPFSVAAEMSNFVIESRTVVGKKLATFTAKARLDSDIDHEAPLSATELSLFAKAAIVSKRKSPSGINIDTTESEDAWIQFTAMTKTLVQYGCLSPTEGDASNETSYHITDAGKDGGLLGFENSLWGLLAVGSVWGRSADSSPGEKSRAMDVYDELAETSSEERPKNDADEILAILQSMTASQLAGYISCIIGDNSNRETGTSLSKFSR